VHVIPPLSPARPPRRQRMSRKIENRFSDTDMRKKIESASRFESNRDAF